MRVVGGNCPTRLRPWANVEDEPVDLLILAPTAAECSRSGWLEQLADSLSTRLERDGVVYVLAPARWRRRIARLMQRAGFSCGPAFIHLPNWESSRYLVPIEEASARYALSKLMPNPDWKRLLGTLGSRLATVRWLAASYHPFVGFAARRSHSRPLFEWLSRLDGSDYRQTTATICTSYRGKTTSAVLHRFAGGASPDAVAKLVFGSDTIRSGNEAAVLAELGHAASAAGAHVPRAICQGALGEHLVLLESVLHGQSAAAIISSAPARAPRIMEVVAGWLQNWNTVTATGPRRLTRHELHAWLTGPAAQVGARISGGETYSAWIAERCQRLNEVTPLVAAHGDLTTWNILIDHQKQLGVIDWEEGRSEALPLVDFFYTMCDAAFVAHGGEPRLERFRALEMCLAPTGRYRSTVKPLLERLVRTIGIPDGIIELSLHACFLAHAVNEQQRGNAGANPPFRRTIEWIACHRQAIREWLLQ